MSVFAEDEVNRKLSAVEMFGSSDSEAVSECDFSKMKGGSSEGDESGRSELICFGVIVIFVANKQR